MKHTRRKRNCSTEQIPLDMLLLRPYHTADSRPLMTSRSWVSFTTPSTGIMIAAKSFLPAKFEFERTYNDACSLRTSQRPKLDSTLVIYKEPSCSTPTLSRRRLPIPLPRHIRPRLPLLLLMHTTRILSFPRLTTPRPVGLKARRPLRTLLRVRLFSRVIAVGLGACT